jgi:hypothetical protein
MAVDILFYLKAEHEKLLSLCQASSQDSVAAIQSYLDTEEDLLLPEFHEFIGESSGLAAQQEQYRQDLAAELQAFHKKGKPALVALGATMTQYLEWQQRDLLPKIRVKMPTHEREQLGQIFDEVVRSISLSG